ncbi:hypothetical protein [Streptomyces sp. NRRL F-5135]|uniref:hypothetical protein n=1 Tax=Streptomyces sp. NRRL F-5135 TaxID=1463858 RepID=UPI000AFB8332|nr:hypothetical protein [Streptomyces sp. NRRL F-5135]
MAKPEGITITEAARRHEAAQAAMRAEAERRRAAADAEADARADGSNAAAS